MLIKAFSRYLNDGERVQVEIKNVRPNKAPDVLVPKSGRERSNMIAGFEPIIANFR